MEKASKSAQRKLIRDELVHGRDLARGLQAHIKNGSSPSQESSRLFIEGLVNSYNTSIFMLSLPDQQPPSDGKDRVLDGQRSSMKSRKRKCIKWVKQVTLAKESRLETALEDGYIWRKYGQKAILGSKYPRGYYRCAHKTTDGCLAKKHVQRTDEQGPPVFSITYCGVHTCNHLQHQLSNFDSCKAKNKTPSFPEGHPQHGDDSIVQGSGSILCADTTHIEPLFPSTTAASTTAHINLQSDQMNNPISPTSWFADSYGGWEFDALPSDLTPKTTVGLYSSDQQIEFDPLSDFDIWDFSGR